jgi:hypothetical protein
MGGVEAIAATFVISALDGKGFIMGKELPENS